MTAAGTQQRPGGQVALPGGGENRAVCLHSPIYDILPLLPPHIVSPPSPISFRVPFLTSVGPY